jgi:uncharacterized protein YmfQ (DUF2313 family)
VAVTLEAWLGSLQALLPPGRALTREAGAVLTKLLQAIAAVFSRTEQDLEATQVQYDPLVATTLLADWERLLALPDGCTLDQELSTADRQRIASQRLMEQGGQSRAYFISLAEQLGEPDCTITEFQQATCGSNCNDALYSEADEFAWRMNVRNFAQGARSANCDDHCNNALQIYTPNLIECPITKRRPAHTKVLFAYDATSYAPADLQGYHTRASKAWAFNDAGVLTEYAANVLRVVKSPVGLLSALREPASTNRVRNNTMAGAAAGSPGTAPTNWNVVSTGGVVTRTIVGTGIEQGIDYVDIRYQFSGAGTAQVLPDSITGIPAAFGQFWTFSTFVKMVGGSLANLTAVRIGVQERDGVGTLLQTTYRAELTSAELTGDLAALRREITREFTDAGTGSANGLIQVVAAAAADITLRIGLPQMEQLPFATSPMVTTGAAVTRARDEISIPISVPAGAAYSQFIDFVLPTVLAGVFTRLTDGNTFQLVIDTTLRANAFDGVVALEPANVYTLGTRGKVAGATDASGRSIAMNGGAVATDAVTAGAVSSVLLGQHSLGNDAGAPPLYIHEFRSYRWRLPGAELQALTT